jgi:predicted benzoate:H+ symporter BenE
MIIADSVIDWGALWQVIWISAVAGIAIATVLGVGIVASLHAQDTKGTAALGLNAVTVISVILVGVALVTGIYFITDK